MNGRRDILYIDTVGFLKDLPHDLIESFHATLEEVEEADVLIHVLDVAHPRADEFKSTVEDVLQDIHASEIPMVLALNKADLLNDDQRKRSGEKWPDGILISAKEGLGMNSLNAKLMDIMKNHQIGPAVK